MRILIFLLFFAKVQGYSQNWIKITKDKFCNQFFINERVVSNDGNVIRI